MAAAWWFRTTARTQSPPCARMVRLPGTGLDGTTRTCGFPGATPVVTARHALLFHLFFGGPHRRGHQRGTHQGPYPWSGSRTAVAHRAHGTGSGEPVGSNRIGASGQLGLRRILGRVHPGSRDHGCRAPRRSRYARRIRLHPGGSRHAYPVNRHAPSDRTTRGGTQQVQCGCAIARGPGSEPARRIRQSLRIDNPCGPRACGPRLRYGFAVVCGQHLP